MRSIQYVILGLCLALLVVMHAPDAWLDTLRNPSMRMLITIGIVLFLFILPAFMAVLLNEKVRPGERKKIAAEHKA